jgi:hypothetical protein
VFGRFDDVDFLRRWRSELVVSRLCRTQCSFRPVFEVKAWNLLKIMQAARHQNRIAVKSYCGNAEVIGADLELVFLQLLVTLGGFSAAPCSLIAVPAVESYSRTHQSMSPVVSRVENGNLLRLNILSSLE